MYQQSLNCLKINFSGDYSLLFPKSLIVCYISETFLLCFCVRSPVRPEGSSTHPLSNDSATWSFFTVGKVCAVESVISSSVSIMAKEKQLRTDFKTDPHPSAFHYLYSKWL